MEKIMLIKAVKSEQYNKIILTYAKTEIIDKEKFKGVQEYLMWIDKVELYNEFKKEDFMKVIDAELGYSAPDFNGKCSQIIKSMVVNGRRIELK